MTNLVINNEPNISKELDRTLEELNVKNEDTVNLIVTNTGYSDQVLFDTYTAYNAGIHKTNKPLNENSKIMLSIYAKTPEYVKLRDNDLSIDQIDYILNLYNTFEYQERNLDNHKNVRHYKDYDFYVKGIYPYRSNNYVVNKIHGLLFNSLYSYNDIKYCDDNTVQAPGIVFKFLLNSYASRKQMFMLDNTSENKHLNNMVRMFHKGLDLTIDVMNYENDKIYKVKYSLHPYFHNRVSTDKSQKSNSINDDTSNINTEYKTVTNKNELFEAIEKHKQYLYINGDIICNEECPLVQLEERLQRGNIIKYIIQSHWIVGPKCQRIDGLFKGFDFRNYYDDVNPCKVLTGTDHLKSCYELYKDSKYLDLEYSTYYSCENAESMFEDAKDIKALPKFYSLINCNNMFRNSTFNDKKHKSIGARINSNIAKANNIEKMDNIVDGCNDVKLLFNNKTFDKLKVLNINKIIGNSKSIRLLFNNCNFKQVSRVTYKDNDYSIVEMLNKCKFGKEVNGKLKLNSHSLHHLCVNSDIVYNKGITVMCNHN